MGLNPEIIQKRCEEISDSLERLEKIKQSSKADFLNDKDLQDIACYRLLVAIEAALNLCYHVSAKLLKKNPSEYGECFVLLGQAGIVPEELANQLRNMARFRNMLVHMYWNVDFEMVFEIIQNNLNDLRNFSSIIASLL
ncbi:MAG: type VII toxin-antitoxin system HepT family RNase toxin [Candidatus Omnitrophota bacterium]